MKKNAFYSGVPFIVATCQNTDLKRESELFEESSHPRYLAIGMK